MHRFFVAPGTLNAERIALPAQIAHQVTRVLRLGDGERIVLLGAEGRGLRPGVQAVVDHRVRIPLGGRVASLNVATAATLCLYASARAQRR